MPIYLGGTKVLANLNIGGANPTAVHIGATKVWPEAAGTVALTTDVAKIPSVGGPVVLTATQTGGTAPYIYRFQSRPPGGEWVTLQDWSATATYTDNPVAATEYQVRSRDAYYPAVPQAVSAAVPVALNTVPSGTIAPTAPSVLEGDPITFTVTPAGGTPPYTQVWQENIGGAGWTVISGETGTSYTRTTALADNTGTIRAKVRDALYSAEPQVNTNVATMTVESAFPTLPDTTNLSWWFNADSYAKGQNPLPNLSNGQGGTMLIKGAALPPTSQGGKCISFQGAADEYGEYTQVPNQNIASTQMTFEFIVFGFGSPGGANQVQCMRGAFGGYWFGPTVFTIGNIADYIFDMTVHMNPSGFNICTYVLDGGSGLHLYVNGVLRQTIASSASRSNPTLGVIYAFLSNQSLIVDTFSGEWADIKTYHNRAMSAAEVLAQYDAQKSYYGLT